MPEADLPSKVIGATQQERDVGDGWLLLDGESAKLEEEGKEEDKVIDLTDGHLAAYQEENKKKGRH